MDRTAQVTKLLKFAPGGFDLCRHDKAGLTSLHYATLNGNINMVTALVKEFTKYGLSVDEEDITGMTPLMHAQKLGFDDIANILEDIGHANMTRFENKLFQSVNGWKQQGEIDGYRKYSEKQEMNRIYGKAKSNSLRVLPELDPRGLYRTKTTMVPRSETRHLSTQRKSFTLPAVYQRKTGENLRSILKYKNEKTMLSMNDVSQIHNGDHDDAPGGTRLRKDKNGKSIGEMMDILSDQICDSYKDPAVDKIQEMINVQKNARRTSTLASILNKVKVRSDEMERKLKLRKELDRHTRNVKKRRTDTFIHENDVRRENGKPKVRIQLPPIMH